MDWKRPARANHWLLDEQKVMSMLESSFIKLIVRLMPKIGREVLGYYYFIKMFRTPPQIAYEREMRKGVVAYSGDRTALLRKLRVLPALFHANTTFLLLAKADAIHAVNIQIRKSDIAELSTSIASGKGLILACTNFSCFYFAILKCKGVIHDILLIQGDAGTETQPLIWRLEKLSGVRIATHKYGSDSSIRIYRHLKSGGVIATMVDTYLDAADVLIAPFMGRQAASPAGLYQIACRLGSDVVPLFCLGRGRGFVIETGEIIAASETTPQLLCESINREVEDRVNAHPDQWMAWGNLSHRWDAAENSLRG